MIYVQLVCQYWLVSDRDSNVILHFITFGSL